MILFWTFLVIWSVVHILFEYRFFKDKKVFDKYQSSVDLVIAAKVYYTKAIWMFILVWMMVLGLPLQSAIAWSFLAYSVSLLVFFPIEKYHVLNGLLASGMVIESLL